MAGEIFSDLKAKGLLPAGWNEDKPMRILITGKTGTGKSTLINGIVGAEVTEEGTSLQRCTTKVIPIERVIKGVKTIIWDTPGLQDKLEKGDEYVQMMQSAGCGEADLVLYCTRMDDTRMRQDDIEAIKKLTSRFGEAIWNRTLIILTFANKVEKMIRRAGQSDLVIKQEQKDYFEQRIQEWKKQFDEALINAGVPKEVAEEIIPVPAGYDHQKGLPDRDNWFTPLWYACIIRMKPSAQASLLKANINRIKHKKDLVKADFEQPLSKQPIVFSPEFLTDSVPLIISAIGAVITAGMEIGSLGGPVGTVVGGVAGAALSAVGIAGIIASYFVLQHRYVEP